ncbi:MAG: hypothetical protein ACRDIY_03490 [Chloroflexota bacterium]
MGKHFKDLRATVSIVVGLVRGAARAGGDSAEGVDYEALVQSVLLEAGSLDLSSLIERVAAEAMRIETIRGAWVTDVALWGPDLFRRDATIAVRGMIGRSLALEFEGMPIAIPVLEGH